VPPAYTALDVIGVSVVLGVSEDDAPSETEGVGDDEIDANSNAVVDGVTLGEPVNEGVGELVGVTDGVLAALTADVGVGGGVDGGVGAADFVALAETPGESVVEGEAEIVDDSLVDTEPLSEPDGDGEGVAVGELVGV